MACLSFSRNFGHQIAVSAGLKHARGEIIAVLDADLQDPPELLESFIAEWRNGYDVVYGVRTNRKESWFLRICYSSFYRLLDRISSIHIPRDAGDFALMDRKVVDVINTLPEHNRFVRGLRGWVGFKQIGVKYARPARYAGKPKLQYATTDGACTGWFIVFFRSSSESFCLAGCGGGISGVLLSRVRSQHIRKRKRFAGRMDLYDCTYSVFGRRPVDGAGNPG